MQISMAFMEDHFWQEAKDEIASERFALAYCGSLSKW